MMKALSLPGKAVMQTEQKNDGPSLSGNGYDLIFVPTSESLLFLQAFVNPHHLSVTPPLRETIPSLHVISVLRSSPSNHPTDKNNSSNNTFFYLYFYLSLTLHHTMPSLHVISALASSPSNHPMDKNKSSSTTSSFYLSSTLHHAMPSLHVISALVSSHSNQPKDKNNSSSTTTLSTFLFTFLRLSITPCQAYMLLAPWYPLTPTTQGQEQQQQQQQHLSTFLPPQL
jgi:hypothetical protein